MNKEIKTIIEDINFINNTLVLVKDKTTYIDDWNYIDLLKKLRTYYIKKLELLIDEEIGQEDE